MQVIAKDKSATIDLNNLKELQNKTISTVTVRVTDGNENPGFNTTSVTVTIPENAYIGSTVYQFAAKDKDLASNGHVYYVATQIDSVFELDSTTGILKTKGLLDYEKKTRYEIIVHAKDRGLPSLNSSVILYVEVTDVNDVTPVFDNIVYTAQIAEDAVSGAKVVTVKATDGDKTLVNRKLTYSLQNPNYPGVFSIAPNGDVTVSGKLDREALDKYEFLLTATEVDVPVAERKVGSALLLIDIVDTNDNAPVFTESVYTVTVPGDTTVDSAVKRISTTDRDLPANSAVTYSITSGNAAGMFRIDTSGVVVVNKSLSKDVDTYTLGVKATNGRLESTATVNVKINHPNYFKPAFNPTEYVVTMNETNTVNKTVVRIQASDADRNESLTYSLLGKEADLTFSIDEKTGDIKNKVALDYEFKSKINFFVKVEDKAGNMDVAEVIINLLNVKDTPPSFLRTPVSIDLSESAAIGSVVMAMPAVDWLNKASQFTYAINSGNDNAKFAINNNGVITTLKTFNYDTKKNYTIVIEASDGGLSSTAELKVNVKNTNNFKPVYSKALLSASVKESPAINRTIMSVAVDDADKDAILSYTIIGDVAKQYLTINAQGEVKNLKALDFESINSYDFVVVASDSKNVAVTSVKLTIEDIADSLPVFSGPYSFQGPYTYTANRVMITVSATDKLQPITYSITDPNNLFQINTKTAEVSLKRNLTLVDVKVYQATVVAKNSANLTTSTVVTFNMTNTKILTESPANAVLVKSTGTSVEVNLDLRNFFGDKANDVKAFDVYVQEYNPNDANCK